jgi:hypothetical protein
MLTIVRVVAARARLLDAATTNSNGHARRISVSAPRDAAFHDDLVR